MSEWAQGWFAGFFAGCIVVGLGSVVAQQLWGA